MFGVLIAGMVALTGGTPTVTLANSTAVEPEAAATPALVSVRLSRPAKKTVTVRYRTVNGTAVVGSDYAATSGTLSFKRGQRVRSVAIPILPDAEPEDDETIYLTLTKARNARLGLQREAQVKIPANDLPGPFLVRATLRALNGDGRGTMEIRLDPAAGAATFTIDVSGMPSGEAPFATHAHANFASYKGPESLTFFPNAPLNGHATGTVEANRLMILELLRGASRYIIHVHTPRPEYGLVGTLVND
jgi:hypothetical protein